MSSYEIEMPKEERAEKIISTGCMVNIPDPHHPGKRIVGWRVDEDLAGLSSALFALEIIRDRALPHPTTEAA
jgi:hypothetical protein